MTALAIVVALAVVAVLWWSLHRKKHPIDSLPGPPSLPLFGNTFDVAKPRDQILSVLIGFAEKYWPIYRTWLMNYAVIHPLDPKYVEPILASSQHIAKSHAYVIMSKWLGDGLLTSTGAKWHSRRKMLTPAFHFKILEQFVPVFSENTKILVKKLRAHVGKQQGVDIVPLVTHCALDVICETAMGTKVNAQEDKDSEYVSAMYELNDILVHRMFRPWLFPDWIFNLTKFGRRQAKLISILHGFTIKVIRERRVEFKKMKSGRNESTSVFGTKKKTAFLDLLLEVSDKDNSLTDEDIREEVDTFMFEGHDTTAMAMSWALHFLGTNLEVQEKCVKELSEIFSGSGRSPEMSDLNNMKYLERVIKETLRLRPSVFIIGRKLEHTLKLDNIEFPADTRINLHIYSIHRNPEIFPDPEKFDPDRFLPENCVGRHPYAYIPFSAGPRNCIGQKFAMLEMKSLLSTMLRHFRLESLDPELSYEAIPDLILRPKNGIQLKLYSRRLP